MKLTYDSGLRAMAGVKAVSFDIFDTALQRKVAAPAHIFDLMETGLAGRIQRTIPDFARARMEAETRVRSRRTSSSGQMTLEEIYQALGKNHGLDKSEVENLQRFEIETEQALTYGHPLFLRLYHQARQMGLTVFFLSDMYLPSTSLQEILEHHGYAGAQVFVSAEQGGNKASGRLYRIVQEKLRLRPAEILHFGDNFYADYLRARWNGWRAIHTANCNLPFCPDGLNPKTLPATSSLGLGLIRKKALADLQADRGEARDDFWDDFGYRVAGPVYFGFLHWLCLQAKKDGVRRLLLCARDGYPLLRGFEILRAKWNLPLETPYFHASRQLFNLARIRELSPANLEFLLMPNPGLRVRDFVSRLGFDPQTQERALLDLGFTSLDEQIVHSGFGRFIDPLSRKRLEEWIMKCQAELLEKTQAARRLIRDYFAEMRPGDPDTAVVDLGWRATVCESIQDLLSEDNPEARLRGYFFGTYASAQRFIRRGGRLESCFFHLGEPARRKNVVAECEGLIELLFYAPHGSISGLKRGPAGIEAVHGICEYTESQLAALAIMREGAYRFVTEMTELIPNYEVLKPPFAQMESVLTRLQKLPTLAQAQNLGRISYRVSYGDQSKLRPLAAAPASEAGIWRTFVAYEEAPWKQGFLAQQSFLSGQMLKLFHFAHSIYVALTSKTLLASLRWFVSKD